MMKIEQKRLAQFCGILQAIVPECRLMINAEGWNTMAVDTANVAMVSAVMLKAQFTEFTQTETQEIGMDMTKWKNMLDVMKDPASTIEIEQQKDGKIRITDGKYTYTHAPLDVNTVRKRPNPPNINLPASIAIDAKEFNETIKALSVIGDKVRFTATGEVLELKAEGDTDVLVKTLNYPIPGDSRKDPIFSLFSLDYLSDMSKAMKEAGSITLLLGQDHPIRMDFEIDGIEASFLVAPRIEAEGGE